MSDEDTTMMPGAEGSDQPVVEPVGDEVETPEEVKPEGEEDEEEEDGDEVVVDDAEVKPEETV
jgi:hypothetical protein